MNSCSGLCRLPEDDTIFLVINYCMSFGIYSCDRPVLAHRAVFYFRTDAFAVYKLIISIVLKSLSSEIILSLSLEIQFFNIT